MIISRTPYRISFFGGGTDYPAWYREHGGAVLATTINKYCHLTCRYLPPFFEHRSSVVWSQIELVREPEEIKHPAVREALLFLNIRDGVALHHDGDLPARSGLGSSSTFTVSLLHALHALQGRMPSKMQLAREAIRIEQERLKEHVGVQDQILAACGGFNRLTFRRDDSFEVTPMALPSDRIERLQDHLLLFYTGISRWASEVAAEQIKAIPAKQAELGRIHEMVEEAVGILNSRRPLAQFGEMLHESWLLKRSLTRRVSNAEIDAAYEAARRAGALGGKILGAGGGGFLLFFAPPERHARVMAALDGLLHVPFRFETFGSQIIFYEPNAPDVRGDGAAGKAAGKCRARTREQACLPAGAS
jgi:D-glycero-alpha-D-manno-heptose-7-phosphate kinase